MSHRFGRWEWFALLVVLLTGAGTVGGVVLLVLKPWARPHAADAPKAPEAAPGEPFPLPPYTDTAFLNAGPDARYVGSAACAACHRDRDASYRLTAHSRALADLDPAAEPPDGSFTHPATGRTYRVYRQGGQLRHEEVIRTAEGREVARVDLPVRYLVGSGNFTRSYLVEVDGFLHESPITWYTARKKWDVSPGYDFPVHASFERPVGPDCLGCHSGRAETVGGAYHKVAFHEQAIGCENCHGPGSLHADLRRARKPAPGEEDRTIVHPGKLPRQAQEDICAACHLSGPATVDLRGRKAGDFRPGRPLTDYRVPYRFEGSARMTVVGHVEQLRQSKCYQKSADLTCVTCHDPHRREVPKDRAAFYRQKCLACHETQACRLDPAERRRRNADDCTACHMPRGDTEIPHVAFTHHRIGRHAPPPPAAPVSVPTLVAASDESAIPPTDRRRNLGLAYFQASLNPMYRPHAEAFQARARELLEAVDAAGLRDPEVAVALAQVHRLSDPPRAREYARQTLESGDVPPRVRVAALTVLTSCDLQEQRLQSAVEDLEKLTQLQRNGNDWRLLGETHLRLGQPAKAEAELGKAVEIRPFRPRPHEMLAEADRLLGDAGQAAEHRDKARWLREHRQE